MTAAFILVDGGKIGNVSLPGINNDQEVIAPVVTDETYKTATTSILSAYATDHSAAAAYDALILLRVPPSMQQLHFDLVVAFGKLASGSQDDGEARLTALKAQYPWLPL